MSKNKIMCLKCKAQFYSSYKPVCGTCDKPFCPNCSSCKCTNSSLSLASHSKRVLQLKDINKIHEDQVVEVNATLSPLIGQTPTQTSNGIVLKTEFELTDDHQKVPLVIWGPVPERLFPYRYEYSNLTISGLKKRVFNGKPVLIASKQTKYFVNNLRTKPLDYFISESVY